MGQFKHHSSFPKEKHIQSYLLPHVCFECCKSFKKPLSEEKRICPQCGNNLVALNRKFSAPKATDTAQWKKVQFLVANGFYFQSIYEQTENSARSKVSYPATLEEAKVFVTQYQTQAIKNAF